MSSNNNPRYTSLRIVVGISAQVVKFRVDEETIKKLLEKQWWKVDAEGIETVKEMEFRVGEYVNS